jgi:hypothetical protein
MGGDARFIDAPGAINPGTGKCRFLLSKKNNLRQYLAHVAAHAQPAGDRRMSGCRRYHLFAPDYAFHQAD